MQLTSGEQALLRVGKANMKTLALFEEGHRWITVTSKSIDDLLQQVCVDRLAMADSLILTGDKLMRAKPAELRSAISRYYYSMYHSVRAVVYFAYRGDDHEAHSTLPTKLPQDFPSQNLRLNDLKDARSHRNDADYDPYPLSHSDWKPIAADLRKKAPRIASDARQYLRQKGCAGV